ncbi:hypothetical protein CB1_000993017 [Camelus ferus]|nr:hypothetical protein CB1_000993017 [Camelus ferus]
MQLLVPVSACRIITTFPQRFIHPTFAAKGGLGLISVHSSPGIPSCPLLKGGDCLTVLEVHPWLVLVGTAPGSTGTCMVQTPGGYQSCLTDTLRPSYPHPKRLIPYAMTCVFSSQGPRWHIDLQPWAGPARSLDEEALRFLRYISTTQVEFLVQIACDHMSTDSLATDSSPAKKPWSVCLDDRFGLAHQIRNKQCRLYSLGLGSDDTHFEVGMANDGCEVHCFDPSVKSAHVLESERLWYHRVSVDWRDPHPAVAAQKPYSSTRKLGTILNEFGHRKIDVLKADLESAEWKVLENLILEDVLEQIGQLIFEIHLHWPGFEVSGSDSSVVRFWYSLLKELELQDFRLFHSYKDLSKPQLFLKKDIFNASSCYTLSWVNTRWK